MKLYLVQHGEASPEEIDPARPLTAKGRKDVQKVASFLKKAGIGPLPVRHSGKMRARETAEMIASFLGAESQVQAREKLDPQDPVQPLVQEISGLDSDLMVAGHLPFLGKLASALLTGSESQNLLSFRQGGVVCLNRNENRIWQVAWMVIPDILRP
jgi:phosphohistidine phosphatase